MKIFTKNQILLICILSLFWIVIRLTGVNAPLVSKQFWRQTDTASIARNFYQEDMNIFYPQVNWRGDTKGYVESEFQIYSYLVAIAYKITGKANDRLGKLISIFFSLCYGLTLFFFVRKTFDLKTAFLSFILLMLFPVSIYYSQTFMPESMMIFFYVFAITNFYHWINNNKLRYYLLSMFSFALALLIKPTAIFLVFPIFSIAFEKYGEKVFKLKYFLLYFLLIIVPSIIWYKHAYSLFLDTGLSFGILSKGTYSKFMTYDLLYSVKFWEKISGNIFSIILTPFGAVLFFISVLVSFFDKAILKNNYFFLSWILSIAFFVLVVAEGNQTLEYYLIFLIIPASVFIARIMIYFYDFFTIKSKKLAISFVCLTLLFISLFSSFEVIKRFKPVNYTQKSYDFALKIQNLSNINQKFIVIDTPTYYPREWFDKMKHRIKRPSLLYYLNRTGWVLLPHEIIQMSSDSFFELIDKGAKFFVLPKQVQYSYPTIHNFIIGNKFNLIKQDQHFYLYSLDKKTN